MKELMKGERDFALGLRHGREGEETFVYKRMGFGCLETENLFQSHHHVHHSVH